MTEDNDDKGKHLQCVVFNPSKSVTYRPIPAKQKAEIELTNNEKTPVIFKWKSTRPGMYQMRPVYGVIKVGGKTVVNLICKGIKDQPVPTSDRFTCVLAASPSENVNPSAVFSNQKYQQKLAQTGKMRKVKLLILYQGVNDQVPNKDEDEEEVEDEKDKTGNMRKKEKTSKTPKEDPKSEANKKKKPIVVMFMRKDGDSASGEEDEGDEVENKSKVCEKTQGTAAASEMKTVANAGAFNAQSGPVGGAAQSTMKTVAPAGVFNAAPSPAGGAGGQSAMKTVAPAGAFSTGPQTNKPGGQPESDMKTVAQAGTFSNLAEKKSKTIVASPAKKQ